MKKKGFTLIELLAVILILGILALIAIPIVNGIVKESRKSSFNQTNKSVANAVSSKCNTELIKGNSVAGTYYIINGEIEGFNLELKGQLPDNGYVVVDSQCNVAMATYNSRYCATKELIDDNISVLDYNSKSDTCSVNSEIALPVNDKSETTCFMYTDNGNNTVTITGYNYNNTSCSKDLVIPTTIDGKKVTTISDFAFVSADKIVVTYIDPVSNIYTQEFIENFTGLKNNENYYYSLESSSIIGRECNKSDNSIVSVDVNYIHQSGDGFKRCYFKMASSSWSDKSYNAFVFNSLDLSKAIYLTEIPDGMIMGAGLTSIKLNSNINRIGSNAFQYNNITESLTIPSSVKELGSNAFLQNQITELNLPNGLETIGYSTFYNNRLASIVIPNTVIDIGNFSFSSNLITSVVLSEGLKEIGTGTFVSNQLTNITIPSTVEIIGAQAFCDNNLQSLTIPNNVLTIGEMVFAINQIQDLTIGTGITTIPIAAFQENSIENIIIPNTVTDIGDGAFAYNSSKTISLGNGVKTIGPYAFLENKFTTLTIPNSVVTINHNAFRASRNLTSLIIGTGLTSIGANAFSINKLATLNIPNNVKTIATTAFASGNLTSVTIGSGITSIGTTAFNSNSSLTSITINRLNGSVTGSPWGATNATVTWTGSV